MTETDIQAQISVGLSNGNTRLFRANAGKAWQGEVARASDGVLVLRNYRRVLLMPEGTPDLIGWRSHTITADEVGSVVAVFVGIECKSARGKYRKAQQRFGALICQSGGIAGIARSVEEARVLLDT